MVESDKIVFTGRYEMINSKVGADGRVCGLGSWKGREVVVLIPYTP